MRHCAQDQCKLCCVAMAGACMTVVRGGELPTTGRRGPRALFHLRPRTRTLDSFTMQLLTAASSLALSLALVQAAPLNIYNQCGESIALYDNSATQTIASGGKTTRTLSSGFNGMFRNGVGSQATLAEFSITGGFIWYDISIIPTGSTGPGNCGSLEACKAVTGGTGFNTAMQIAPSGCATVTCMADGCTDAYQYPSDDGKTHSCADTASIDLIFCPGGSGTIASTTSMTPAPTTAAPTAAPTTAPTAAPTATPTAAPTAAPTPVPTTAAPRTTAPTTTAPPTPEPTTATPVPTTAAPTPEPTTSAPQPTTSTPKPATETPAPVSTSSWSGSTSSMAQNSTSSSSHDNIVAEAQAAVVTVPPEARTTATPSTRGSSGADNTQTVSTQNAGSGPSTSTYVMSVGGAFIFVAAIAAVVIARRKKQQLDAMEPKESFSSYVGILTPRGEINVLQ